jgi:hypothetical protein
MRGGVGTTHGEDRLVEYSHAIIPFPLALCQLRENPK